MPSRFWPDKHRFYLSLLLWLLGGFALGYLNYSCWLLLDATQADQSGALILTGLPFFAVFGSIFLVGTDIFYIVAVILWFAQKQYRRGSKNDKNSPTTLTLP